MAKKNKEKDVSLEETPVAVKEKPTVKKLSLIHI